MQVAEDIDWSIRMQENTKTQARIDRVLYHYNFNIEGTTQTESNAMTARDVSYIVLKAVHNPSHCFLVDRCLRSVKTHAPESEIILVANGCEVTDIERAMADVVVELEMNVGYAAGCNQGAAHARRPLVCFLNDDAEFVDDSPQRLAKKAAAGDIVAPFASNAKPPQACLRENTPAEDLELDAVVGVCMMMTTANFWRIGGFDTRLLTYEDDDLCARARLLGIKCRVVGSTWVNHDCHQTFKALGMDVQEVMNENQRKFQNLHPKIKVICIAKDEEASIEGFFSQFGLVTSDWNMLDTGSTDKTVEIAKSMGVHVERFEGEFDFATARNEAAAKFAEEGDWIIMMDLDERLDQHTLTHLREFLTSATRMPPPSFPHPVDFVLAPLQAVYPDGTTRQFVAKPIAYRCNYAHKWVFKVHEKLVGSQNQILLTNAMNNHVIAYHDQKRRTDIENVYARLMSQEPYHTDSKYKAEMRAQWPILDYDRMDDNRIRKVTIGPLISVIIPTYKRPALVGMAVASVTRQDYLNYEIIVMGDNCPLLDGTLWPNSTANAGNRIRKFNLPKNHGAGGAAPRNYAILYASGQWIAYLDDDNQWLPDHLSSLYELARTQGKTWAFSSMQVDGKDMKFTEPKFQGIDTSCILHRKDFIRKHGSWKSREEAGTYAHDWEIFERWVKAGEPWVCSKKPTLIYNAETSGQEGFLKQALGGEEDANRGVELPGQDGHPADATADPKDHGAQEADQKAEIPDQEGPARQVIPDGKEENPKETE
jgi:GT2 family glycosyltransferase